MFKDENSLIPAIIQDNQTGKVLMLGYMNKQAYDQTLETKKVTFFSRSKNRIWVKGETSGNFLHLVSIKNDCDKDTFLVQANPVGPVCHTGTDTCWAESNTDETPFYQTLEKVIRQRRYSTDKKSYVKSLFDKGIEKIAQKVGEEGVEVVIEAMRNKDDLFIEESSDLFFHYLILLEAKGFSFDDVLNNLKKRAK